ncbi:hypothetical protein HanPI659440_Chr17g0686341 [Helianthus annuus]|nr:hypothetical protein HanPI659440_Chr17g0686341 [Helianthus annuus]
MGLKEALRLKSFDSTELDIRATKTLKGDPPYLTVVKVNLYSIREPVATTGQGGSSLAPLAQAANVTSAQAASVVSEDKGKKTGSNGGKDSDEGVNTEGGEDDAEVRPQVSFKRGRNTSSKPDPNLKKLKKTKLDLKTVVLEDEVDQVTGFSAAGKLDAHLHCGKTPRDRPVNLPPSPLSFGGLTTKVIDDANMPDPLAFKKIDFSPSGKPTTGVASNISRPSPQQIDGGDSASSSPLWYETEAVFICWELGSGDAVDVDSTQALERMEQKEMQSSYDQLLADHLRLVNDKAEIERARDKAIESHLAAVTDMKDMLNRYDGEMVELYGLTSELFLTKQWFLTEGVAWVVKLVHQSPELEKLVVDLVNIVNAVGVNDGIKQGFQAAKGSARTVDEVLGYDEGAKDTLDAAIKAFDIFHISVLDKVSELVNEPLSVIKEKGKLPIVKED